MEAQAATPRRVIKYFQIIDDPERVRGVFVEPQQGRVNVVHVAEAVHVQYGGLIKQLSGIPRASYCFFKTLPEESGLGGTKCLQDNEQLGESDGSESVPLYLSIRHWQPDEIAWIRLVKRSSDAKLQTSAAYAVPLLPVKKLLMAEVLDGKAREFGCNVSEIKGYFIEDEPQRFPLNRLADGYFDYTFYDSGSRGSPRQVIVFDDDYFDNEVSFSSSRVLKNYFKFKPKLDRLLEGTYVDRFNSIESSLLLTPDDQVVHCLKDILFSVRFNLSCIKEISASNTEMTVRSAVSSLLYSAVATHNIMANAPSKKPPHGDLQADEPGEGNTGKRRKMPVGKVTKSSASPHTSQVAPGESLMERKRGLTIEQEMDVSAIIPIGCPEWKFIKVNGKIDFAVCHSNLTDGARTDATLVTLEAKTMDTFDKDASLLQAYTQALAVMELRKRKGRGWPACGVSNIQCYVVLTNGIEWRFFMLEGESGKVEVKGIEDERNTVMLKFDPTGLPTNAEEVFGLLVEMVEKAVSSSPRASKEKQVTGRASCEGETSKG